MNYDQRTFTIIRYLYDRETKEMLGEELGETSLQLRISPNQSYRSYLDRPQDQETQNKIIQLRDYYEDHRGEIATNITRPRYLTDKMRELLQIYVNPVITNLMRNAYGPNYNTDVFMMNILGITSIDQLVLYLQLYIRHVGGIPEDIFFLLYDDLEGIFMDDAFIPDDQLTPEQLEALTDPAIPARMADEGPLLTGLLRNLPTDHYPDVYY